MKRTYSIVEKRMKAEFLPLKYFEGLSETRKKKRVQEIRKFGAMGTRDPKAYVGFETDKEVKTRKSGYTQAWNRRFPLAKSLEDKSKVTGVPLALIKDSYNRGMAAWRTGHRPGATQQQWGYARVSSFLLCGKTALTTDSDLVKKAKKTRKGKKWYSGEGC